MLLKNEGDVTEVNEETRDIGELNEVVERLGEANEAVEGVGEANEAVDEVGDADGVAMDSANEGGNNGYKGGDCGGESEMSSKSNKWYVNKLSESLSLSFSSLVFAWGAVDAEELELGTVRSINRFVFLSTII